MATTYGKTWWGEQWLGALKNIDYSNRLPRGSSYARRGMVKEINFAGNVITAKVKGSRPSPYRVTIVLPKFTKKDIDSLIDLIVNQPVVLSKLYNRQLDESLVQMAEKVGMPLFPKKWSDLKMDCSCPDWAVPCKHLAAVIYKISMEIDNNPFLVFTLHGLDLMAELETRGIAMDSVKSMEVENVSTVFDSEFSLDITEKEGLTDYTHLQDLVLPLSNLLPSSPAFCHEGDFKSVYQKELAYVAKSAGKVLLDKTLLFFGEKVPLTRHDECSVGDFGGQLYQSLLEIDADRLPDYSPTVIAARQIVICALQMIAHGCIVPQIYYDIVVQKGRGRTKAKESKEYRIIWQPAMIDDPTRMTVSRLGQQQCLLSRCITDIVHILAHPQNLNFFAEMFFNGLTYGFSEIGETNTPGGIRSWLDRYFIQNKYQVTFKIEEGKREDRFAVDVMVDGVPLEDISTKAEYDSSRFDILRQLTILCDIVDGLKDYINGKGKESIVYSLEDFSLFLMNIIPSMKLLGVNVLLPKVLQHLIRPQVTLRLKTTKQDADSFLSMGDLLAFNWRVAVGDETLSPEEFMSLIGTARGLLRFKGKYLFLDEAAMAKLSKALTSPAKVRSGELLQAALSGEYKGTPIELTDEIRKLIEKFTSLSEIPLPQGICAQLRPYQQRGFSWMYRNIKIGFGSIIADDMGLGKTLQVITLLSKIKEEGALKKKKALVVVPTGLLHNWENEVARFAPNLSTATYHGPSRDLSAESIVASDIVLSTYGVVRSDVDKLKKCKWQILVVDEAQNIKNIDTAQSKAIHSIPAEARVAMSGTPVENRLSEFWSIMDFVNKGYLGSQSDFYENYTRPIQKDGNRSIAEKFKKITGPFMMRRLKTDKSIITDLPDKIERNQYAALTAEQAAIYQETVNRCMSVIEGIEGDDSQSLFKRQGLILQMILALKQICNHPTQYLKDGRMEASLSGKTEMLLDLLRSIVDAKEKVLVFTQFREMGDLLRTFVRKELDEEPMFYHGGCSLKQRQEMVERFQNDRNSRIFILSLKAAGTGLNLTAATNVIHYDLWWNPAVEAQATDRAYRIGQHNNVQVYRFITKDTFEEKIDDMIQRKKYLADMTVSAGENWIGKLSNKELHEIFG